MKVWIVVEGLSDLEILRTLLPDDLARISQIVPTGGLSNMSSLARTLIVKHKEPVAVLADADSLDPRTIWEKQLTLQQLMESVSAGIRFTIILCIPTIEALFCEHLEILRRTFPAITVDSYLMQCKTQPKQALEFFFEHGGGPRNLSQFLRGLVLDEIEKLRRTYPMPQLIEFIREGHSKDVSKK